MCAKRKLFSIDVSHYCTFYPLTGIEKVVTDYLTQITQISEATRDFLLFETNTTSTSVDLNLYMRHNDLFRLTIPMNRKLQVYMQNFVRSSVELHDSILVSLSLMSVWIYIIGRM